MSLPNNSVGTVLTVLIFFAIVQILSRVSDFDIERGRGADFIGLGENFPLA